MKRVVISWGKSLELARNYSKNNNIELVEPQITKFSNGETRVFIEYQLGNYDEIIVIKSLTIPVNDSLMELLFVLDALNRNSDAKIIGIFPWLCYSPQDEVFRKGEPLSSQVIANILSSSPLSKIYTFDIHSINVLDFYKISIQNIIPDKFFAERIKTLDKNNLICVALDKGAKKRSKKFADNLDIEVLELKKKRDLKLGSIIYDNLKSKLDGKTIVAIDDYTGSGSTLIDSAKLLKNSGAKEVIYCVTHLFDNGTIEKIEKSDVDLLIATNSSIESDLVSARNIEIIDASKLIEDALA